MKLTKKLSIAVGSFIVVAGVISVITTKANYFIKQAAAQIPSIQNAPLLTRSVPPHIDLNNPQVWNNNPSPKLPANKELSTSRFISREQAIGTLPPNAVLISADLMPWGQHEKETLHGVRFHEASQARMVWTVKIAHLKGIDTNGGFFANATQTVTYDGETGQIIDSTVTGKPQFSEPPDPPGYTPNPNEKW